MRIDPSGLLDDHGVDREGQIELIKRTDDSADTLYSVTRYISRKRDKQNRTEQYYC